jgi:hypothetical protein
MRRKKLERKPLLENAKKAVANKEGNLKHKKGELKRSLGN